MRAWGPAAAWATVLFLLSAWPDPIAPVWLAVNDKLVHLGLYSVMGGALAVGWLRSRPSPPHWLMMAVGALYGATDEWHQIMVPGRFPSWSDWIADLVGVVLGYLVVILVARALIGPAPETQQRMK